SFLSPRPPPTTSSPPSLPDALPISDVARHKILGLMAKDPRKDLALRFAIDGRGPGGYRYRLGFVAGTERASTDRDSPPARGRRRSEEHTSELQSLRHLVCRLLLEKK